MRVFDMGIFNKKNINPENKESKKEQAKSFAKLIIDDKTVLNKLNLTKSQQIETIEDLIYIHEENELFEICEKLNELKNSINSN